MNFVPIFDQIYLTRFGRRNLRVLCHII